MPEETQRRLTTIVAADIAGFSRLVGVDEESTLAAQRSHRAELIEPLLSKYHGRVANTAGDSFLFEFPSAVEAVRCSMAVQEGMVGRNRGIPADRRIEYRIGVNVGDVVADGDDLLGDGVNIAARLENICEPGGIFLSDDAYRQIRDRLEIKWEDCGEHEVKNIKRPVQVWRWAAAAEPSFKPTKDAPLALPDKPSIAVLPFDNMSDDPEQEFFADGITEDIITELSRFNDLFVIARNSVFTYKGRATKVQDVGKDLGVRYVAEGSVRRAGDRVRVTVQLIEAETGAHLWAEKYDRKLVDIFDLQDELTSAIVGTLPGRLRASEEDRIQRKPPSDMAAFDYLLAGKVHHHRATKEDNAAAIELLDMAIALDPRFAQAYAWKTCTLGQAIGYGFCDNTKETLDEAIKTLHKAHALDENDVECHRLLCDVNLYLHQLETAKVHADRALSLNPNDPRIVAQQGEILTWQSRSNEAIEWLEKSFRLDPLNTNERAHLLGRALYACRRYDEAIEAFKQKTKPRRGHLAELASCYAQAGMAAHAEQQAAAELRLWPDFSIGEYIRTLPFVEPADRDHLAEGLRKAGLPE